MKKVLLVVLLLAVAGAAVFAFSRMKKDGTKVIEEKEEFEEQEEFEEEGILDEKGKDAMKEMNEFGFKVFRAVQEGKDLFLSPMSLSMALSLVTGGAANQTEAAMMKTLGFEGWSKEEMGAYFRGLGKALLAADSTTTVEIANSIWAHNDTELKDEYVRWADENYGSTVEEEDFDAPETLNKINGWCAEKTHDKITSILDQLSAETKMLLLNALYFNGNWVDPFSYTYTGKFHALKGGDVETKLMEDTRRVSYYEEESMQAVSLPYGNGSYSAVIILPREGADFVKFAKAFDGAAWERIVNGLDRERVHLTVPKFKMEYEVNLNKTLKELGMSVAFSNGADFSLLAKKSLKIGLVKQKTYVDFNEKGTEAAAVTAIAMLEATALPIDPIEFRADRPFLLAIRERKTGAILFLGQKVE